MPAAPSAASASARVRSRSSRASSLDRAAYRADAYVSAATFGAAVILVLAALYLEYGCRVPTPQDGPGEPPDG